jgi:hypothetical protein
VIVSDPPGFIQRWLSTGSQPLMKPAVDCPPNVLSMCLTSTTKKIPAWLIGINPDLRSKE